MRFHLSIIVPLLWCVILLHNLPEKMQPEAGACVKTAAMLAARHPGSRILFVRYFSEPIGHALVVYRSQGKTYIADYRGAVAVSSLAYDSAYIAATFAPAPIAGYIFSSAAFVYGSPAR